MTKQLIHTSDLINNAVLTINSAKELGRVHDILYNISSKQVIAVVLDKGGWFSDAKVIMADSIHSLGEDIIMVESEESVVTLDSDFLRQQPSSVMIDNDQIKKRRIVSENGTKYGKIDDLSVDTSDLEIISAKASDGFFENMTTSEKWFPISAIQSIGNDAVIVSNDVVPFKESSNYQDL